MTARRDIPTSVHGIIFATIFAFAAAWMLLLAAAAPARSATRVSLLLVENAGVDRAAEPVTGSVPIPRGELFSVDHVRLLHGNDEVCAQFRPLGLWRPGSSIRWLLVDFVATIGKRERQEYVLEYGPDVRRRARSAQPLRVRETEDAYLVETSAAKFLVSRRTFSLFEEVRVGDEIVVPRRNGDARIGAWVRGLEPTVTRAIPASTNTGRSHLIFVQNLEPDDLEDYRLEFVTDREYTVTGQRKGLLGKGEVRKDFKASDGSLAIPRDAWLNYALPKRGDRYTFRSIPEGHHAASEGVRESKVIERGPLRSVIRLKGSFGPSTAPVLEYTVWYHFYAGSGRVKVAFTLENNDHGGRTDTGNARNADIGGVNSVFFDAMTLRVPLAPPSEKEFQVALGHAAAEDPYVGVLDSPLELYQDSSGGPRWNRYAAPEFHPRPNSYVRFKGYRLFKNGAEIAEADRAAGWLELYDGSRGVRLSVRDFWQNYPKGLGVDTSLGGSPVVEVALFPRRYGGNFALRSGEHKTHEILLDFYEGPEARNAGRGEAIAFSEPLRLTPTAEWFARSRALGDLHPEDLEGYRPYEVRNLSTIGVFPGGVTPGASLMGQRERYEFHGWMDYGDVPIDFENAAGQWGMKYDMDYHMAQQFARTLRPQWWRLFEAAARHVADIDIHHQPHYPGLHFVKGGVWAHSLHGEAGHKNPHRNRNHFTKDLCFGARGTALLYYMTGRWKARDACLEIAENALAEYMSPQRDPGPQRKNNRMGWRGDACTLNRLLEGYLLTGAERFLERIRWQIKSCAFDGRPPKHGPISLWSSCFYIMALARYVEMFPEDDEARSYLLAHIETLRKGTRPKSGILYTITPHADGTVTGRGSCSHYNIMAADAFAIAYRLTGQKKYIETARRCFAYGVKNACGEGCSPTYFQVHCANGSLHGNVFLTVDARLKRR